MGLSKLCAGLYARSVMTPSNELPALAALPRKYENGWLVDVQELFGGLRIGLQLEQFIGSRTDPEQVYFPGAVIVRLIVSVCRMSRTVVYLYACRFVVFQCDAIGACVGLRMGLVSISTRKMVLQPSQMCGGPYVLSVIKHCHAMQAVAVLHRKYGNGWLLELRGLCEELRIVLQLEQFIGNRTHLEQVYFFGAVIVRLICYTVGSEVLVSICMHAYL